MGYSKIKIIVIALVASVIAGGTYVILKPETTLAPAGPIQKQAANKVAGEKDTVASALPAATGDVDKTVDAILKGAIDEQMTVNDEDVEANSITADSQQISDFGQSSDDEQF